MSFYNFYQKVVTQKASRVTEIFVGILFLVPPFGWLLEFLKKGITETFVDGTIFFLALLPFGIVLLLPRKAWRDFLIYFLVFVMAGLSFLFFGFESFKTDRIESSLSVLVSIGCFVIAFMYFKKIKSALKKADT